MEARVKPDHKYAIVRALAGQEYVKYEWRPVPADREEEAQKHLALETRVPPAPVAATFAPVAESAELVIVDEPAPTADQIGPANSPADEGASVEVPVPDAPVDASETPAPGKPGKKPKKPKKAS